jgi:hypothetical protein
MESRSSGESRALKPATHGRGDNIISDYEKKARGLAREWEDGLAVARSMSASMKGPRGAWAKSPAKAIGGGGARGGKPAPQPDLRELLDRAMR